MGIRFIWMAMTVTDFNFNITVIIRFARYVSSEAKTKTTTEASRKFNKYFNRNSEQTQQPPNLKQIPQRYDLRNFRLLICLERTFLRASAAVSSISKSSVVISADFCQDSNPRLLEFEDKTSSDKSFLLYLLLNQGRRRQRRRKNSRKKLEPLSPSSTTVSSIKSTCEFHFKSAGYSTLCVLQYFCSDYLVYKKERSKKQ